MLAENLKALRKAKGLSQEELAARLHVVRQTVSKWEKGRSVPDADLLVRLAEELDTTPAALLGPELPPEVRTVRVPEDVMASISPMESPQGALFLCRMWDTAPPPRLEGGRYLVLDGLQDPGNVGTIWRTADALEADGLLLVHGCADPFGPKVVRATMGACFRLPVWETGPERLAGLLERSGLALYATALREDTEDIKTADLSRSAVVIGSEGRGVSPELLAMSQRALKIPMRERCESLNAAAAAAVVLWEMGR